MANNHFIGGTSSLISLAANWSLGTAPTVSDTAIFDYQMTQAATGDLSSIDCVSIIFDAPAYAFGTSAAYGEMQTDTLFIRDASVAIYLDLGSTTAVTATIDNSTNVNITASNASGVLNVNNSTVNSGIAFDDTPTWSSINKSSGTLEIGEGATLTTVNSDAGNTTLKSAVTTINVVEGNTTTEGSGAVTTVNLNGKGIVKSNSTGVVTTVNADNGGTFDMLDSSAARSVTTFNQNGPHTLKHNDRYHTIGTLAQGTFNKPTTIKLTQP